jgi:co-chaperonin GroES (HSP10)
MKPLRDLILITLDDKEQQTESGLFITKSWEDAVNTATVDEVGPEVTAVKKGDHVTINPYAVLNGRFIKEKDIIARG